MKFSRWKGRGEMTSDTALMTDMAILIAVFLLGFLAKMFPKNRRKAKQ
jgi:hypothetical protein